MDMGRLLVKRTAHSLTQPPPYLSKTVSPRCVKWYNYSATLYATRWLAWSDSAQLRGAPATQRALALGGVRDIEPCTLQHDAVMYISFPLLCLSN